MKFSPFAFTALAAFSSITSALSPAQWRSQSIYQVLTDRFARTDGSTTAGCNANNGVYCGGTFQGIINKLDYIQNMGFTAIWISPVVTNIAGNSLDGSSYHGYWAQDIYSINSNFGTKADLVALSAALHARGMYLMVDVVTNHMGYLGCGSCVDYSIYKPFNSKSYYHDFCLIDYNNVTSIKSCWEGDNIVSLPDMRTEDSAVASVWNSWITALVANYSIDGLRIDSAQQVNSAFFPPFQSAAGVHVLGEVFNGDPNYVCPYQTYMSGVLNYPAYFWITQAFQSTSGSISNLVNGINTMKSTCSDTTLLGSFLENHDVDRFPSLTSDESLAKNAIAFTILADGTPIIYEGQEQHYAGTNSGNYNRAAIWLSGYPTTSTFYTWIAKLNQIRNQAIYKSDGYVLYKAYPIYSDSSTIAMRKGDTGSQIISVYSNLGASGSSYTLTLTSSQTGFTASQALIEVMGCTAYTADSSGNLAVAMAGGLTRVFYPKSLLTGSGICPSLTGTASSTSTKATTTTSSVITTTSSCTAATSVAVTFNELVTTTYGQTIKLSGSIAALGSWDTSQAIALSAASYTSSNPLWTVTVSLAPGTVISYKFINVASSGTVTWEADPNRSYTVPSGCATAVTVSGSWQG
ncbi:glycoside hydrolase family 13 protein [Tricladium varicosporioides]|nr:glycoside hydrolase family 13 protein [Hymenoscyphus varicosporioides]